MCATYGRNHGSCDGIVRGSSVNRLGREPLVGQASVSAAGNLRSLGVDGHFGNWAKGTDWKRECGGGGSESRGTR